MSLPRRIWLIWSMRTLVEDSREPSRSSCLQDLRLSHLGIWRALRWLGWDRARSITLMSLMIRMFWRFWLMKLDRIWMSFWIEWECTRRGQRLGIWIDMESIFLRMKFKPFTNIRRMRSIRSSVQVLEQVQLEWSLVLLNLGTPKWWEALAWREAPKAPLWEIQLQS